MYATEGHILFCSDILANHLQSSCFGMHFILCRSICQFPIYSKFIVVLEHVKYFVSYLLCMCDVIH